MVQYNNERVCRISNSLPNEPSTSRYPAPRFAVDARDHRSELEQDNPRVEKERIKNAASAKTWRRQIRTVTSSGRRS